MSLGGWQLGCISHLLDTVKPSSQSSTHGNIGMENGHDGKMEGEPLFGKQIDFNKRKKKSKMTNIVSFALFTVLHVHPTWKDPVDYLNIVEQNSEIVWFVWFFEAMRCLCQVDRNHSWKHLLLRSLANQSAAWQSEACWLKPLKQCAGSKRYPKQTNRLWLIADDHIVISYQKLQLIWLPCSISYHIININDRI